MIKDNPVRFLDKTSPPHISTLILLSGIGALAMNMFLPSLPAMAEYFDADYSVMQLSVPLYLLCSAVLQVLIGPISDNLGRRNVLLWGLAIYMVATVGCIYAPTTAVFLAFRCVQAIVAVSMVLSRAVVRDMFAQDKAASMIGYVTMGMALVPMISPAVGGLLEQSFGWQATFWAMFWIGALVLAITWFDLGETHVASGRTLTQQFAEYPELLGSPRFWGYSMAAACCSGAFFAYLGGAPFVGSVVFGMEPAELGIYFGAPAVGYFLGNFITARKATVVGVNTLVLWGCLANAIGGSVSMMILRGETAAGMRAPWPMNAGAVARGRHRGADRAARRRSAESGPTPRPCPAATVVPWRECSGSCRAGARGACGLRRTPPDTDRRAGLALLRAATHRPRRWRSCLTPGRWAMLAARAVCRRARPFAPRPA